MANTFNRPIILTGTMANDYLTTIGAVAGNEKPLRVIKVVWTAPGVSGSFVITDGSTAGNVLLQGVTPASFAGQDVEYDFEVPLAWRNFKVTTLSAGTLLIFAR